MQHKPKPSHNVDAERGNGNRRAAPNPDEWLVRLRPRDSIIYVTQSRTVLATGRDGFITNPEEQQGLWVYQTRMLSRYRWLMDGKLPLSVSNCNVQQHSWLGYYIASPTGITDEGHDEQNPTQQTLELRLARSVADGMHEDVDVTNFTQKPWSCELELEIDADFADHAEVKGERQQQGELHREWRRIGRQEWELNFDYRAEHCYDHQGDQGAASIHRGLSIRVEKADSEPQYTPGRVRFRLELAPHATWHACLNFHPQIYDLPRPGVGLTEDSMPVHYACHSFFTRDTEWDAKRGAFLDAATRFRARETETLEHVVIGALEQAKRDLASLRLYDFDLDGNAWATAAGLPIYVGMFGRDMLTSAWEASFLGPEMMRGALATLPRWQGNEINDWRDEQPGKMPHEAHTGPLSSLNFSPHGLYYGEVTASIYYPTVVSALWHWTGDKELVRPFIEPALRGLRWADQYGDIDGDGFYEYQTYSEQGEKNQGWKDSGDAIVYEDGAIVEDPLGTCEMQGFAYVSKLHFSELLWWLDRKDEAHRLFHEAEELKKRFNNAFWMADEGYIAMALDANKRQVKSIASDPGHCLASGIVDHALIRQMADRFTADDLFSGWGIRTLSARHPAFNPYAYHRGTVWPVENGVFALAFARYGLHDKMHMLCKAMFEAASLYDYYRLPELLGGHQRDQQHPFPGAYPHANWPQAWSASCVFTMMQAMLGLYPYAPLHTLLLDPWLPEWLPEITVSNLRIGEAVVSLRFWREDNGATEYEIVDKRGHLHVVRQPSPWSLTAGFGERVKDAVESLLPVR
ncbi:MAG: glycogen debranching N-terminal domain-containing protein [Terriglobales bacterium]